MNRYEPGILQSNDIEGLRRYLDDELRRIASAIEDRLDLDTISVLPSKPREGMIRYLDGTNTGTGEGPHVYLNGAWVPLAMADFGLEVARGNITNVAQLNKFGRYTAVGTTELTVWDGGTDYITTPGFAGSELITHIWSTDAADTSITVVIEGLDDTFAEVTTTKATDGADGTTAVALDDTLQRINRMYVADTTQAVGNLRVGDSGKTAFYSQITIGANQTGQALYTVPLGKTLYLYQIYADQNDAAGATVASSIILYAHDNENTGNVRRQHLTLGITDGGSSHLAHKYPSPWPIPEKWDVYINASTSSGTRDISAGFEGFLVTN